MVRSTHIIIILLVAILGLVGYSTFSGAASTVDLEEVQAQTPQHAGTFEWQATPVLVSTGTEYMAVTSRQTVPTPAGTTEPALSLVVYDISDELTIHSARMISWDGKIQLWNVDEPQNNERRDNNLRPITLQER